MQKPKIKITKQNLKIFKFFIYGFGLLFLIFGLLVFVRTAKPKTIFPNAKLVSEKSTYKAVESPKFTLALGPKLTPRSFFGFISTALADEEPKVYARVLTNENKDSLLATEIQKNNNGTYAIKVPSGSRFKPGKYKIEAQIQTSDGTRNITQDFSWGVLAININKSIYKPFEQAKISMGVLNEGGFNVCDADLTLSIENPKKDKIELSSKNKKIKVSDECFGSNVTYIPDYSTTYQTAGEGVYQMKLSAVTKNGKYEIEDFFEVRENPSFDVERITATRINPVSPYEVKIKIKANTDFDGEIVETVPFDIRKTNGANVITDRKIRLNTLKWKLKLKKGQNTELSYTYKAPEVSPEFYLLGPLEFRNSNLVFREARQWQIAVDPTSMILLWDPANGATPSGWTCISCSTGDTFFQKIIRGNTTYGGTGGQSSVTPTVNTTTVSAESASNTGRNNGSTAASGTTHTHTTSNPTIGSQNIIPAFKTLMVIKYDSGIPSGGSAIPANAIAFFDATVPTGWTRYSAQDGNYIRGDWTNTAGGSNTNTFTVTWQSLNAASTAEDVALFNAGTRLAPSAHTHTAPSQTTSAAGNTEPPYIETILGYANSTTSIPVGIIGMFDGAPGAGWNLKSDVSGDPFYQTFPKASASYGTTGGSSTHTPANETSGVSGVSGATLGAAGGTQVEAAGGDHTHTETSSFNSASSIPSYTDAIFAKKIYALSGTVKQSDESTAIGNPPCSGATNVIEARVNGGAVGAATVPCSSFDSSYSLSATASASDIITVYLNSNSTPKANTVLKAGSSSDITSVDLYQNVLIARDEAGSGITNAAATGLGVWDADNDATNMLFTANTNNLSVNSNIELHVWTGDTYSPGGTVTTQGTGNLHVDDSATATLDTATNTIGNDINIDTSATLNINGSTIVAGGDITATGTLNTTSGTPTVTMRGTGNISGAGSKTFYNLTIGDATVAATTLTGAATVNNNASVGTGSTFNINANLTVTGSLTNTTTGIINQTANSPIVTVSGSSIGGGSGAITFYRLQKAGAGTTTFSGSGTNVVNDTLDATAGTLTLSTDNVITVTRNVSASNSATLNQNTALTINGGNFLTSGTGVVNTTAGTGTVTMSGTGTIGGGGTVTVYNLVINGSETLASATTTSTDVSISAGASIALGSQNLNVNGGDFTTTGTGTITCSGCSGGTVTMSSTGSLGGGSGAITFYNLSTSGTGTTTFTGSGTNTVNNNVSVGAGTTLNLNSSMSITGNLTNTTTGIIGTSAGTPTVTVSGTSIGGGSGAITFYNLIKSGGGTTTFSGSGTNAINNDLTVNAGTFTQSNALTVTNDASVATGATFNTNANLNINGGDLATAGTGVINTTAGTGTTTITGTGNIGGGGTVTVYALTISGTQTLQSNTTTNNNLSVSTGSTLALNDKNFASAANFATAGTGTITCSGCTAGTVTLSGTGNIGGGGTVTVYNLTSSGGTQTVSSGTTVLNDLTANATINGSSNVTVNGTVAGTGTISMSGGTFEQRVAAAENFGGTGGNAWSFATLLFSNSSGVSRTVTTQSDTGGITVSTLLQVGKSGDTNETILAAGNRTWTISGTSGTPFNIVSPSTSSSLTANTSTFSYTGANGGGDTTVQDATYNNLTINASDTFVLEASPLNIDGDLTVTTGTLSLSSNSMVVGSSGVANSGDISVAGSITQSASGTTTVRTSSGGAASIGGAGTLTFYNLTIAPAVASEPTITLGTGASQTITVSNDLTIGNGSNAVTVSGATNNPALDVNGSVSIAASGTLTAPGSAGSLNVATNFTNNGTFNHNSGTVTFDTTNTAILNGSGSPAITFSGITFPTAGKTVQFTAGKTFRINGLFTVTGSAGNLIRLDSTSSPSQWTINHQGTESITYARVQDSACDGTSTQITLDTTSVDAGNNGTCWVFQIGKRVLGPTRVKGNMRFK